MTLEEILALIGEEKAKTEVKKLFEKKEAELAKAKEATAKAKEATVKANECNKAVADKLEKVLEAFGIDGDDDEFEDSLAQAVKSKSTDAAMQRKLSKMQKKLDDATAKFTEELKAERSKRFEGVKRQKLLEALNANNTTETDLLVDLLIGKVEIDEDDESITSGGKAVEEMITSFLKDHPSFVKNSQNTGANSNMGNNHGNNSEDDDVSFAKRLATNASATEQNNKVLDSYFN